jgi:hypothetical protein
MDAKNMSKVTAIWLGVIWFAVPGFAEADWEAQKYSNGTYAALSMTLPTRDERHAVLNIDFDARRNCTTYIGLNVYTGSRLGNPIAKERMAPKSMSVQTARLRWVGGETQVNYTNGFEAMMAVGEDVINAIKRRGPVYVQVGSGPRYEFPAGRNFNAIDTARRGCWAMR